MSHSRNPSITFEPDTDSDDPNKSVRRSGEFARNRRKPSMFRNKEGGPMYQQIESESSDKLNEVDLKQPRTHAKPDSNNHNKPLDTGKSKLSFLTKPFSSSSKEKAPLMSDVSDQHQNDNGKLNENKPTPPIPGEIDNFLNVSKPLTINTKVGRSSSPITTATELYPSNNVSSTLTNRNRPQATIPIQLTDVNTTGKGPDYWLSDDNQNRQEPSFTAERLESENMKSNRRRSSDDSTSQRIEDDLFKQHIFDKFETYQVELIQAMSDDDKKQVLSNYYQLIISLGMKRTFFNPELEILNRFCLEYSSIAVKTEEVSIFSRRRPSHQRVFDYMIKRTESVSTPINSGPVGPEVPVLLMRVFLNEFRINSSGESSFGVLIPILSHSNRISLDRFKAISENIFNKLSRYYKSEVDISRYNLTHLN